MVLKDTINALKKHVEDLQHDLQKATNGVKAASQRVRIGTIKLAKIAKIYRKESIVSERGSSSKKSTAKKRSKKIKSSTKIKKANTALKKR